MIEPGLIPVVAARFKALSDPGRLSILAALHEREMNVSALVAVTGRSQPNVSQHLAGLARAGFVAPRREGNHTYYRIADPYVARLCDAVCSAVERQMRALARPRPGRRPAPRR